MTKIKFLVSEDVFRHLLWGVVQNIYNLFRTLN